MKDAKEKTHEVASDVLLIEFVSADSPTVPIKHADPQHTERWVT